MCIVGSRQLELEAEADCHWQKLEPATAYRGQRTTATVCHWKRYAA